MDQRFVVLSLIAKLLWGLGWIIAVGGIVVALAGGVISRDGLVGLVALTFGLVIVACSEIIGVLFAIERNTRARAGGDLPLAKTPVEAI